MNALFQPPAWPGPGTTALGPHLQRVGTFTQLGPSCDMRRGCRLPSSSLLTTPTPPRTGEAPGGVSQVQQGRRRPRPQALGTGLAPSGWGRFGPGSRAAGPRAGTSGQPPQPTREPGLGRDARAGNVCLPRQNGQDEAEETQDESEGVGTADGEGGFARAAAQGPGFRASLIYGRIPLQRQRSLTLVQRDVPLPKHCARYF